MTTIEMTDLTELIKEADLPTNVQRELATNPYLMQNLLGALGGIDFNTIETTRAYAFLLLLDRSSSVSPLADTLISCYRDSVEQLKEVKTTGELFGGCVAITSEVEGGEVLMPFTRMNGIKIDDSFNFVPNGRTPLYDTVVVSLAALKVLVALAKRNRVQLTAMAYIISDGQDFGSTLFSSDDAAEMVSLMTNGRRKHRVSAVAVGVQLKDDFLRMGIAPEAIREIGTSEDDLQSLFDEMSQSVTVTSQGGDAGGF
jgi:uncharacterized protein YegL